MTYTQGGFYNRIGGQRIMPTGIPGIPFTQGQIYHCRPGTDANGDAQGSDSNTGLSVDQAKATVKGAHDVMTANQNDICLLYGASNSGSQTTDYVASPTLEWSKDMCHLVGIAAPTTISHRARISNLSTWSPSSDTPLMTISADGCVFDNWNIFCGVADANAIGAILLTGARNYFSRLHIAGIGNATQDAAGAYSLFINGSTPRENLFYDCTIGLDTIARGTAGNSEILLDGGTARNEFRSCKIISLIEHTTNHPQVKLVDATAVDRYLLFKDCLFYNWSTNYAVAQTGIFKLGAAMTKGEIIVWNCAATPADNSSTVKWCADDRNQINLISSSIAAADTGGTPRMV